MYGNSVKKLKTKFLISFILGIIMAIAMLIVNLMNMSLMVAMLSGLFAAIVFPFEVAGLIINTKKILWGIIKPIPILSFCIQWFVGIGMAVKAFIWMVRNWNNDDLM